jgi:hypothetical protein
LFFYVPVHFAKNQPANKEKKKYKLGAIKFCQMTTVFGMPRQKHLKKLSN